MNKTSDWNPGDYLQFKNERTQPAIDLANRINLEHQPKNILDVGCGPGNSGHVLSLRWPGARLIGIDNSPAMIEKAKTDYPQREWIFSDALSFESDIKFDVIFSNAAIQWIPGHDTLFEKLNGMLSENGAVAVQIPKFHDMSLGKLIHTVSMKDRWKNATEGCIELFTIHDYRFYYDLLSRIMNPLDMWETDYIHVMPSHKSIIDWTKSTGLKPYLDRIEDEDGKKDFEDEVLAEIKKYYPAQKNGNVLFPFKRLFFIGYKNTA